MLGLKLNHVSKRGHWWLNFDNSMCALSAYWPCLNLWQFQPDWKSCVDLKHNLCLDSNVSLLKINDSEFILDGAKMFRWSFWKFYGSVFQIIGNICERQYSRPTKRHIKLKWIFYIWNAFSPTQIFLDIKNPRIFWCRIDISSTSIRVSLLSGIA